jgi:chorismate dehydratase
VRRGDNRLVPSFLPPAAIAEQLASGELEIGLLPSIEAQRIPGLRIVPDVCIAATHEVRSVLLLSKVKASDIGRLALDENSRTSAALAQIVLRERYGVVPECVPAAPQIDEMLTHADAALVIGDPALRVDRARFRILDLADEWRQLTGRPFVFAFWAVRPEVDERLVGNVFHRSLELGLTAIDSIVEMASSQVGLDPDEIREYLTVNLSFTFGAEEREGLRDFFERAEAMRLIPRSEPLQFLDACRVAGDSLE